MKMNEPFEIGKFYTVIGAPYLIVSKAVLWDNNLWGLSPVGSHAHMHRSVHRPSTDVEIIAWHKEKIEYMKEVERSRRIEYESAQKNLKDAQADLDSLKIEK
jgi:hypothetical protein